MLIKKLLWQSSTVNWAPLWTEENSDGAAGFTLSVVVVFL